MKPRDDKDKEAPIGYLALIVRVGGGRVNPKAQNSPKTLIVCSFGPNATKYEPFEEL